MDNDISVKFVETKEELLDALLLKHQDDSETICGIYSLYVPEISNINICSENKTFILARKGNIPIGYAAGRTSALIPKTYWSEGIYVIPSFRNRGIGHLIKQTQIEYAKNAGFKRVATNILKSNIPSIKVHEKLGFKFESAGEEEYRAYLDLK